MSESGTTPTPTNKTATANVPPVPPPEPPPTGGQGATPKEPATPPAGGADPKGNEGKWDAETRSYIEGLRRENAGFRTANKELRGRLGDINKTVTGKDPDADPKEQLDEALDALDALTARNAILEAGYENNIPYDKLDYFGYKIEQGVSDLEEGEELDIQPIVQEVMSIGQSEPPAGAPPTGANTGVNPPKTPPAPPNANEITVDEFKKMGFLAKAKLQRDQPQVYENLKAQAFA